MPRNYNTALASASLFLLLVLLALCTVSLGQQQFPHCDDRGKSACLDCGAKGTQGACGCDRIRTLMQWSYGNSFGGGAPLSEPLVTDRPDFTESSTTVGRGVSQLEIGYQYTFDNDGANQVIGQAYPQMLLRLGILAEWLELRVGWSYTEDQNANRTLRGGDDLYLGLKIAMTPQEGILPEMALIPQMTVPVGSAGVTAGEVLPGLNWVYSWELTECLAIGGQSQFNRKLDDVSNNPFHEFSQSMTVGLGLTDRLGAFTEWFVLVPDGADTARTEHYLDGGFTFLLSDDLQYDVFAGVGLSDASDDYFVGTGLSFRR